MEEQELVSIIKRECISPDGFLVGLRGGEFREENYSALMSALHSYRELIRNQDWLRREIVYCLYFLDLTVAGAIQHLNKGSPKGAQVQEAHEQLSKVIIEILTPESLA